MIINKINFPIYGTILLLSVLIGILYIYINIRDDIKKNKQIRLYFILYFMFAFILGKYYTMFADWNFDIMKVGFSSYGGLIGVVVSALIFEKIIDMKGKLIKHAIISLPLVYGLTKIACFLVGCCYGIPFNSWFSVTYPEGLNIKLFPIQIVETIMFLILFVIVNKNKKNNNISYYTLIVVAILKFLLDFLRYDHLKVLLTFNQYFSIVLLVITLGIFIYRKNKKN